MSSFSTFVSLVYLIAGIYFLNAPFKIIPFLPEMNEWYIFTGGVLLAFAGTKYLRTKLSRALVPSRTHY